MDIEEKLKVLARCLSELQGGEWSVREVLTFARAAGIKVREQTAYAVLYSYDLPGRKAAGRRRKTTPREAINPEVSGPGKTLPGSNSGSNSHERGAISRARGKLDPNSPTGLALFALTSFGTAAENGAGSPTKKAKKAQKEEDLSWVEPLEKAAESLLLRPLLTLTAEERLTVGRYHALHFANCSREAIKNKLAGQKIAAGLMSLGSNYQFSDMTVREYLAYCRRVHKTREGKPWFNPWLIKAEVELV